MAVDGSGCRTVSPAHAGIDRSGRRRRRRSLCLPRPRGDRPRGNRQGDGRERSPPPTRGSTRSAGARAGCRAVSPAHAGIDPRSRPPPLSPACLPRPRGDRPWFIVERASHGLSPPPTRGSTPGPWTAHGQPMGLPRPRGDRPPGAGERWRGRASPPPTRGSTMPERRIMRAHRVSPAHAGIDLSSPWIISAVSCLPRPRGDRPGVGCITPGFGKSPPPTRGSTIAQGVCAVRRAVSPAHAGIDRPSANSRRSTHGLPRPRGDRPHQGGGDGARALVSPAHAGIDPSARTTSKPRSRLPRPRGDRPYGLLLTLCRWPSPPPTRGSTASRESASAEAPVSPAHAGIDPNRFCRHAPRRGLPRPRGDRPGHRDLVRAAFESPPPTRGSTTVRQLRSPWRPVSPAHAGIDPNPRETEPTMNRSPPPTRGSTARHPVQVGEDRVSPAHAGIDRTYPAGSG